LVATVVPSISGRRSRCTPSRLTSPPPRNSARPANLVDLVEEDDAVVLHGLDRLAQYQILVEQLVGFLETSGACASATLKRFVFERPPNALPKMCARLTSRSARSACRRVSGGREGRPDRGSSISISLSLSSPARSFLAERFPRAGARCRAYQRIEHAFLGARLGERFDIATLALADLGDPHLEEIAHICSTSRPT